ncbi:MATE family efflux transporter [Varunaivibrio sulfuroxidans]|uniref:MATE family multidrug resistance protein n=1 Tax=Varunaivibrio sulfuroxidans TaxID=1773489 RepID=A0A4R3JBE0_9PROT|nr:MATE family efflux transporter [Varunaivibrio sulfuroxidans]TCS62937.1 MATE family multidrug resistance protein [Varunaivibrio sulfuroxidans]WES31987.1 MATE family efflux transporter [Varunaivibrio sulfuroxidans]
MMAIKKRTRPTPGTENWNRRIWSLAGPIILSNVSVPLLGAVDTAVAGRLPGPQAIGAVAIGALVFNFIYWGFGFLRMGTSGFTAQAKGAGDHDEVRAVLARAVILALALGVGVTLLQVPIAELAFGLIKTGHEVETMARTYVAVRIWGAPAALVNYAFLGWFIGMQNTRAALYLQVAMNLLNVALDILFVPVMGMGVEGIAVATLISEICAALLALWIIRAPLRALGGVWVRRRIFDLAQLRRMAAVNGDIFVRTLGLIGAFALFTAMSARMGAMVLAANTILLNFQSIMAYALDGFAHAAEALSGLFVGARDRTRFRRAVKVSSLWAFAFALVFSAFYAVMGPSLIALMSTDAQVRETAGRYLPWLAASPLISVWSFQLDGIFIGATRTRALRNAMVASVIVYAACVFYFMDMLGNHGLWLAFMVLMVLRAVTLLIPYPALVRSISP